MLRLVCKYDAKIVFKHMRVLCGKNCISGIPGNDFGEEFVAPQEAPIVYKLEAHGFQIGIVVRNLYCHCLLLRGKLPGRRTYGVFGGLYLRKRRKKDILHEVLHNRFGAGACLLDFDNNPSSSEHPAMQHTIVWQQTVFPAYPQKHHRITSHWPAQKEDILLYSRNQPVPAYSLIAAQAASHSARILQSTYHCFRMSSITLPILFRLI